jgi:hypothetical protein
VLSDVGGEFERDFPHGVMGQLFSRVLAKQPGSVALLGGAAGLARPVLRNIADRGKLPTNGHTRAPPVGSCCQPPHPEAAIVVLSDAPRRDRSLRCVARRPGPWRTRP